MLVGRGVRRSSGGAATVAIVGVPKGHGAWGRGTPSPATPEWASAKYTLDDAALQPQEPSMQAEDAGRKQDEWGVRRTTRSL